MKNAEERILNKTRKCRHFNGIFDHDTCKKGVSYREVRDDSVRPFRWPCIHREAATTCEHFDPWTREEAEEQEREMMAAIARVGAAKLAIIEREGEGARGVAGAIPCPHCDGTLRYSIAGVNGHIHANCSTSGCVRFME